LAYVESSNLDFNPEPHLWRERERERERERDEKSIWEYNI